MCRARTIGVGTRDLHRMCVFVFSGEIGEKILHVI